jgi:hypothetical protein
MWIARVLGPRAFATYTLAVKAIQIFTDCFGDPLDMAVMREAPLHLRTDRQAALEVIRSAFWARIAMGLLSIGFAAALPWVAASIIFGSTDHPGRRNRHRNSRRSAASLLARIFPGQPAVPFFSSSRRRLAARPGGRRRRAIFPASSHCQNLR